MNKYTKGFTLIELLVVIAIIGLLSSVVLASLGQARDRAKLARAAQDLKQINNALNLYLADNKTFPCEDGNWSDGREKERLAGYISWPKNPFGGNYHWEINYNYPGPHSPEADGNYEIETNFPWYEERFAVSIQNNSLEIAEKLDNYMDDGDSQTGVIRYVPVENGRIEYLGVDSDYDLQPLVPNDKCDPIDPIY